MLYRSASAGLASPAHTNEPQPPQPGATLLRALHNWKDAAPDAAEFQGRSEAMRRILHNTMKRGPELNLEGLSLSSLPPGLHELHWLRVVRAVGNRIDHLPHEIAATRLSLIDLRGNPLTLESRPPWSSPNVLTD